MAIAQDSNTQIASSGSSGITSFTISHTCSGANRLLVANVFDRSGDAITSVTYNGTAMTLIAKKARNDVAAQGLTYLYYLLNPDTGTHNLTASRAGSVDNYIILGGTSYTGVKQSAQPDASVANQADSVNTKTTTVTTAADNCFMYLAAMWDAGGGAATAGSGSTLLGSSLSNWASFESSSLALTPAGSKSMIYDVGGASGILVAVMASFAPAASASGPANPITQILNIF